ncbi:MAG: peptide deformylase [Elusimicrobiota bacterium]
MRYYPDPILRKKARKAKRGEAQELYPGLIATMLSYEGVGLACPQVGIDKRIALISETACESLKEPLLLLNPVITRRRGKQSMEEGCLSVMGVTCKVVRAKEIEVETGPDDNRKIIEASGLFATVIQHEIDHLEGILFPDRLSFPKRLRLFYKSKKLKKKSEKS